MPIPEPSEQVYSAATIPAKSAGGEPAVCPTGELGEGSCREFAYRSGAEEREGFLVCSGGRIRAYRNSCPHTGAPLNWLPGRFLTEEGDFIICALHGALFRIEDGRCVAGPCHGEGLERLAVRLEEGGVKRVE
jgi:nitrite reductase/ring-hydroxylating ferredoxin subunit